MDRTRLKPAFPATVWILITSFFAAVFPAVAGEVQEDRQERADASLRFNGESSVSWVLVPVALRPALRFRDLGRDDFTLTVDGTPVPIMSFEAGSDAPVRLIYLQDLSGSMANGGKLELSRAVLDCLIERSQPGDLFALATFAADETRFDVTFTPALERLRVAHSSWQGHGATALHDAVARLPEMRADDRSMKHAAVLVTDGGDNASALKPAKAREILRAAELPLYILDLKTHRPPRAQPADPESYSHLLRLLAIATGGHYRPLLASDLREVCWEISDELRFQYVLGFATRETGKTAWRELGVAVETRGRLAPTLSHRRGYLGRSPLEASTIHP